MIITPLPVFRFAPSPNGRLHLGHAYSALLNEAFAKKTYGRLLLRMEDIDITRCTPEYAKACLEDLAWLGLKWEEPIRVQSHHWKDYISALEYLRTHALTYPCFCSRTDIAAQSPGLDPDGAPLYPGTCTHLSPAASLVRIEAGEPHSWRLHSALALLRSPGPHTYNSFSANLQTHTVTANPARWGDVILARKETPTSYHLSVVYDDALQHVSHVIRGQDLEAATDIHVLLQSLLGLPTPLYHHHALLKEEAADEKLSKSSGSQSLADLRKSGATPASIRELLGINPS